MGSVVCCYCNVIVLELGKMMGMRAFVWFRMVVLFYGAFFAMTRVKMHLTLLFWFYENVVFGLLLRP